MWTIKTKLNVTNAHKFIGNFVRQITNIRDIFFPEFTNFRITFVSRLQTLDIQLNQTRDYLDIPRIYFYNFQIVLVGLPAVFYISYYLYIPIINLLVIRTTRCRCGSPRFLLFICITHYYLYSWFVLYRGRSIYHNIIPKYI